MDPTSDPAQPGGPSGHERGKGNGPVAGRFVLTDESSEAYVTSFDTWEEAEVAFESNGISARLPLGFLLYDQETGRKWYPGSKYHWEDAAT